MSEEERNRRGMCMLLGVVTHLAWGRIFKISPLKICEKKFCTILLEKKQTFLWGLKLPGTNSSLFSYPVRIGNLNKLTIISWRRCHRSLHSSMSASSLVYLRGSELHMGTLVPAAAAKSLQSCPTLCDPIDGSPRLLRP